MGRGKFKGKPAGRRNFSTHEEMNGLTNFVSLLVLAGTSTGPRTFKQDEAEDEEREESEHESEDDSEEETEKRKGTEGLIEIANPNLVKPKTLKASEANVNKTSELSRREREEIEKQKAHERYMRLHELGKTKQA